MKGNVMTNGQVEKLTDALGYINNEMQTLNRTLHDVDLSLASMEASFDGINEGLELINQKLDAILKGNK